MPVHCSCSGGNCSSPLVSSSCAPAAFSKPVYRLAFTQMYKTQVAASKLTSQNWKKMCLVARGALYLTSHTDHLCYSSKNHVWPGQSPAQELLWVPYRVQNEVHVLWSGILGQPGSGRSLCDSSTSSQACSSQAFQDPVIPNRLNFS